MISPDMRGLYRNSCIGEYQTIALAYSLPRLLNPFHGMASRLYPACEQRHL